MFYSIVTTRHAMKVNPFVIDEIVTGLELLDENGQFDKLHKVDDKTVTVLESIETQEFGFTLEFKEQFIAIFKDMSVGEHFFIVDDYLTPNSPATKYYWAMIKALNGGASKEEAKTAAQKAFDETKEASQQQDVRH